ncbi:MAG: copper homeostasis protein CutC [Bacteroidales bacterium]|nr:copper homeostasis protein CutC [Bacteroidales bacterium]
MKPNFLEICVDSIDSALIAQKSGADRIELCANLSEGGTTPSFSMIKKAKELLNLDIAVMIRPRSGDFLYNDTEFSLMKEDILLCKETGVKAVVFGLLTENGKVDIPRTQELVCLAKPLDVCFHRAVDMTEDYFGAIEDIIRCSCTRILTSGQENKAIDGLTRIAEAQNLFSRKIEIMAGSGVNEFNAEEIVKRSKINNIHFSAKKTEESKMIFRHGRVSMGGKDFNEYSIRTVDAEQIKKVREILNNLQTKENNHFFKT